MTSTTRDKILKKIIYILASALFWIAFWDVISYIIAMPLVLPSPYSVFKRFFELMRTQDFYLHAGNSLLNIAKGFVIGALIGTLLGALSAISKGVDILFSPINTVIKATPVASFIILAIIFINENTIPTLISVLMVSPIVWSSLKTSISELDPKIAEMALAYRIPFTKRLKNFYIPSLLPSYLTALITSMGLGWKAGVAAEILCSAQKTLGNDLYEAKQSLDAIDMFAYTLAIVLLSVLMELVLKTAVSSLSARRKAS